MLRHKNHLLILSKRIEKNMEFERNNANNLKIYKLNITILTMILSTKTKIKFSYSIISRKAKIVSDMKTYDKSS